MGFVQIMFSQTELCIVGEVHEERAYMNSDSVYNILLKIKPDVILIELDSTCFTIDFRFIYPLDSLEGNQNVGAEKYRLQYKVDLRPFDVSGRNEWYIETNYFDNQDNMWKDIFNLYKNNELSKRDKEDVDILLKVMNYNWMTVNSVRDLNEERMVKFLSLREKILYPKIVSIVENTEKLRHWVDFARIWETQWFERNAVMADNIKKIAKEYKNKRIVAFVGLEHKPGLLDLLKDSNDFVIREYWTY
jgi:hypothetical protein